MATYSLKGALATIAGFGGCVESGDIDFGELNLVETTCSSDYTKTYEAGTFNAASGSITITSTDDFSDLVAEFGDGATNPTAQTIIFIWPDSGSANISLDGYITNISIPVGVDQGFTATISFTGSAAITFTP